MRIFWVLLVGVGLTCAGCVEQPVPKAAAEGQAAAPEAPPAAEAPAGEPASQAVETPAAEEKNDAASTAKEAAGDSTTVDLSAENTKIQFVCAHVGDKPDPRTGNFEKLTGKAKVAGGTLESIEVEIDAASLKTEIEKLTNHLKSPDFFDVRKHPQVTFKSTSVEKAESGKVKITGDLTLLETTKSITFPATVKVDGGLSVKAEFDIDRTEFGMNYGADKVEKKVAMTVTVGK